MATTHVFIVDATTFKYHLEYQFVGTGAKDTLIDFNNNAVSLLHSTTENNLLGMIADSQRIRVNDYVIFYLQQNSFLGIKEGKFYGVFRIKESPSFLDHNDENQFLKTYLGKSLTFRAIIEPYQVYSNGVTEWEALDEIRNIQSPNQMLWSLIYRKLKGNRGNTMITIYESERLTNLIRSKNNREEIQSSNFTFDISNQKIEAQTGEYLYDGRKEVINVFPRMARKYSTGNQFETHLQSYILQNIENLQIFSNLEIEWIGNEVSCGVGMQRIDIMISANSFNRKVIPIELKSTTASPSITVQLQRYVDWIEQYYLPNRPSDIEPMIISRSYIDRNTSTFLNLISSLRNFNLTNNILPVRYVEFTFNSNQSIIFNEVNYL